MVSILIAFWIALWQATLCVCKVPLTAREYGRANNQSLLWAPYRANCYFGLKPRYITEEPFVLGMMWFNSMDAQGLSKVRHFVEQGDKLDKYGWVWYDPRIGGKEMIIDSENNMKLNFTFVKSHSGENWAIQVEGNKIREADTAESIVLYMKQNGGEGSTSFLKEDRSHVKRSNKNEISFSGHSGQLGAYSVRIYSDQNDFYKNDKVMPLSSDCDPSKPSVLSLNIPDDQLWKAKDVFQTILGDSIKAHMESQAELNPYSVPSILTIRNIHNFPAGNVQYVQQTFQNHFKFNIIFNKKNSSDQIEPNSVDHLILLAEDLVKQKFDSKFNIPESSKFKTFAEETFSNLLGGLSYFHGTQLVDRKTQFDSESFEKFELLNSNEEGPLELFSMVPSRAFFPRGFYWDEGFHLLQLMDYDADVAFEILQSWFNLIDEDGWIPREVILGDEARSKVPEEFQVQNPNIANPPTLLLAFSEFLNKAKTLQEEILDVHLEQEYSTNNVYSNGDILNKNPELLISYAKNIYPRLLKHYEWFRDTQKGLLEEYMDVPEISSKAHADEAYRWVGRTFTHCLPSGMDDYPRALPPDVAELHVDALSWVGVMTRSMKQIATVLDLEEDIQKFTTIENNIIENLDVLHWNDEKKLYCDITYNDEAVEDTDLRKFVCHEGYVSLLPFALKLIPSENIERLEHIIDTMSNNETLRTPFGLRSLSKQDEFYDTGEVYWRGPIWLNINYLCLDALKSYFQESPLRNSKQVNKELFQKANDLYKQLRRDIIENVYSVWKQDGYVYEQYNHKTGKGSGVQHFTGWTALVVNMIGKLPDEL